MVRFQNGPARQKVLALKRAPIFLRVVVDRETGGIDALDQLDDMPRQTEDIHVYRRVGEAGNAIACSRAKGCRHMAVADYELYLRNPPDEVRDIENWEKWCDKEWATGGCTKPIPKSE